MSAAQYGRRTPASVMALIVSGGIAVQVYLAGLAVFGASLGWEAHSVFGSLLGLPVFGLAGLGWLGTAGKVYRRPASLLLLLYLLQIGLVGAGQSTGNAFVAALHPANALAMLLAAVEVMRRIRLRVA